MAHSRLQDDLLQEFREHKRIMSEQIALFDPLATSLRRPAAQRLASKTALIITEILCYLLFLGFAALTLGMNLVFPFNLLVQFPIEQDIMQGLHFSREEWFHLAVRGLSALIALLFMVMAALIRRIRLKNDILYLAGTNIKTLVGQHLTRKAAMEAIEQRHFMELPNFNEHVTTMPNPGYDPNE